MLILGLEPGPKFQEEPLASCDRHAQKIQGSPVIAKADSLLKVKRGGSFGQECPNGGQDSMA